MSKRRQIVRKRRQIVRKKGKRERQQTQRDSNLFSSFRKMVEHMMLTVIRLLLTEEHSN